MIVTFHSTAFNTSTPEKQFLTARAYGSDLANWLLHELSLRNAATEPMIGHKDGWLVRFRLRSSTYDFLISYENREWVGRLERRPRIIDRLFNRRKKRVEAEAVAVIDAVLWGSELISDVQWHEEDSRLSPRS